MNNPQTIGGVGQPDIKQIAETLAVVRAWFHINPNGVAGKVWAESLVQDIDDALANCSLIASVDVSIEHQLSVIGGLTAALKLFASIADIKGADSLLDNHMMTVHLGACRRARKALSHIIGDKS